MRLAMVLLLVAIPVALAQAQETQSQDTPPQQSKSETSQSKDEGEKPAAIDSFREGVADSVNSTAAWFDSFFVDAIDPNDYDSSSGSLTLTPEWDEHDGFQVDSSFRARMVFPHAKRRFSAIIGRGDFDDFINDSPQTRPTVIRRDQTDEEWMLGLGFDPYVETNHNLSFGAGVRGGLNLDPYVRARYRFETIVNDTSEFHTQSVAFWRDSDGFGIAQTFEYDTALSAQWFGKSWVRGTFAERTEGLRWQGSQKIYYMYHHERAIGADIWWYGETDHEVPMRDYGIRALHRSRFSREWLFLEAWVGTHWPRDNLESTRKPRWIVGIELEMLFGGD